MDYLWTPWRYAYVTNAENVSGCIFCDLPKSGDDAKVHIVHRARYCYIVLNTYPYTSGHVMIVPFDQDRKSTRLNSSHRTISYAVFCLKKKSSLSNSDRCSSTSW